MRIRKGMLGGIAGLATAAALALTPAAASAAGPPTTEATNNLSTPAIVVGGGGLTNVTCGADSATPSALKLPTGAPTAGYEIDPAAYYYVQGVNTWQAQCYNAATASATAAWGDNLTGTAKLKTNSPIRVELGLMNSDESAPSMQGYTVVKLEPSKLDRDSAYGTLATLDTTDNTFSASPKDFAYNEQRVYDSGATFSIQNVSTGEYVVPVGTTAGAEINATGNVVYGYNLRVKTAGDYLITYNVPNTTLTGKDAGTISADFHSISLTIKVTGGSGGGGGGGGIGRGHNR